jgi:hypothetical protein
MLLFPSNIQSFYTLKKLLIVRRKRHRNGVR